MRQRRKESEERSYEEMRVGGVKMETGQNECHQPKRCLWPKDICNSQDNEIWLSNMYLRCTDTAAATFIFLVGHQSNPAYYFRWIVNQFTPEH